MSLNGPVEPVWLEFLLLQLGVVFAVGPEHGPGKMSNSDHGNDSTVPSEQSQERPHSSTAQSQIPAANMVMFPFMIGTPGGPKFRGGQQSEPSFQEWLTMQTTMFDMYPLSEAQKVSTLINNLEGEARREVLAMPADQRASVTNITSFLKSIYGDIIPLANLRSQFFTRKQRTDENVRQFALVLQELSNRLTVRGDTTTSGNVLRDQFISGLLDSVLRRELRNMVRTTSTLTFEEIKREAMVRVDDLDNPPQAMAAAVRVMSDNAPVDVKQLTREIKEEVLTELKGEIKEMLSEMMREVRERPQTSQQTEVRRRYDYRGGRQSSDQFDQQGKPICRRCKKSGHIERYCKERPTAQENLN